VFIFFAWLRDYRRHVSVSVCVGKRVYILHEGKTLSDTVFEQSIVHLTNFLFEENMFSIRGPAFEIFVY